MVCDFFSAERAEKIQWTAACFIGSTIINTSETKRQANNSNTRLENNTKETLAIEKKWGKWQTMVPSARWKIDLSKDFLTTTHPHVLFSIVGSNFYLLRIKSQHALCKGSSYYDATI